MTKGGLAVIQRRRPSPHSPGPAARPSAAAPRLSARLAVARGLALGVFTAAGLCGCEAGVGAVAGGPAVGLSCLPDLDGELSAAEARAAVGVVGRYLVQAAPLPLPPPLAASADAAGRSVLDWRGQTAGAMAQVATRDGGDGWWTQLWPELAADLAVAIDAEATLLGLYRQDVDGLWLLAIVSATPNPARGRTAVRYATALPVLRTPLRAGDTWSVSVATAGEIDGLPWQGVDAWTVRAEAGGRVELPDLAAGPTWRVRTDVEVRSALGPSVKRTQIAWMFECMGELARVSLDGDGAIVERRLLRP